MQVGIGLVKGEFRHDIGIFGQKRRKDFANQAVGMGIGIANAQYGAFLLMEGRNSF